MADVSDSPPNDWFPSDEAREIARCVRGCATDEQYTDLVWRIDRALQARRAAEAKAVEVDLPDYLRFGEPDMFPPAQK